MTFIEFKEKVWALAKEETTDLLIIQDVITSYFKNKYLPNLESLQKFVVRCSMNQPGEVFQNISRCSFNPNPETIKLQRCNYPHQQVFYCSMYSDTDYASTSLTCIVETAWEHIEDLSSARSYCTLSRWQCKRPLRLWVLPFSDKCCTKNRDLKNIRDNMKKILMDQPHYTDDMFLALEFITDAFCERDNKQHLYKISSAFYNTLCFFEKQINQKMDGLLYPSANTEGAGINIVLKKDLINDKTLYCDVCMMYSISRDPSNPKNLSAYPSSNESWADALGNLHFTTIY